MTSTKVNKRRYRAKINDVWFYVYASSIQNAKILFRKKGWINGTWRCNDLQIESLEHKDNYERISYGFNM